MYRNCTFGIRVKDELNVVFRVFGLDEADRLFPDVDQTVEGFGGLIGLRRRIRELMKKETEQAQQ